MKSTYIVVADPLYQRFATREITEPCYCCGNKKYFSGLLQNRKIYSICYECRHIRFEDDIAD